MSGMAQENMAPGKGEKSYVDSRGVSGLTVVLTLGILVISFPLLSVVVLNWTRNSTPRPDYVASRDPMAWLFILAVLVACGLIAWAMGRIGRK
jgi:hypothetical protein